VFPCSALSWRGDAAHDPPLQVFTPKRGNTHLTRTNQNPTKPSIKTSGRIDSLMSQLLSFAPECGYSWPIERHSTSTINDDIDTADQSKSQIPAES
jgi:hypothetical protein